MTSLFASATSGFNGFGGNARHAGRLLTGSERVAAGLVDVRQIHPTVVSEVGVKGDPEQAEIVAAVGLVAEIEERHRQEMYHS